MQKLIVGKNVCISKLHFSKMNITALLGKKNAPWKLATGACLHLFPQIHFRLLNSFFSFLLIYAVYIFSQM